MEKTVCSIATAPAQKSLSCLLEKLRSSIILLLFALVFPCAVAYDPLDPTGNITIKWDVISWTPDGYVAMVTMNNYQMYRHIMSPGWTLGWAWAKKEVIWSMVGAQTTEQGDCSKFKGNIPIAAKRTPQLLICFLECHTTSR
ncbi:hypothetical protein HPP92_007687 [Vanilla planifolia]|uniref:COBRA-like protein n=1 Tax=Vanilla planifolia TaxID=51239 RepID=A0A835V7X9_VANPL|nr:hypothetical protein HPP92_007687 [Vanilla planifolia]